MPRRCSFDESIAAIADRQDGLVTSAQLAQIGISRGTIAHRNRIGGMWNRVLPGVHRVGPEAGENQRLRAALLYAGGDALLTSYAVTSLYGLRSSPTRPIGAAAIVDVLIPHRRRRASVGYVNVIRTSRLPAAQELHGLTCAPLARAVADAARESTRRADVLALVTEAVRRGLVDPRALRWELAVGSRRGSRWLSEAIDHAVHGSWSAPEAHLRSGFVRLDVPQPAWNIRLFNPDGGFLAVVDGYIEDVGLAIEVDSRAHHSEADDWRQTLDRSARLSAHGVVVMHLTPDRIWADVDGVVRQIQAARDALAGRPALRLLVEHEAQALPLAAGFGGPVQRP